ncbi:glycosyltransferase family 2 protein [Paenibacillus sp. MBLB4367]|uniref:glycosyltransferase family 2 protein n=1 Tax=Paenibacillus sp. MBLB4367 TaxID=3384767 RepID=UPI003907EDE2
MNAKPVASLIFPVLNEGSHVKRTLASLLEARSSVPFEIILVDDGSVDGCCDFLRKTEDAGVKLLTTPGLGIAGARNTGAEAGTGDYFVFCDAHLFFRDRWLDLLLKPMMQGIADAVSPAVGDADDPQRTGYGQTLDRSLRVRWNRKRKAPFPTPVVPGGCFAVTRRAFEDVGGFDNGLAGWGYEDVELSLRLWTFGRSCWVQPAAKVLHVFRRSFPYEVKKEAVYANMLQMAYSHFGEKRLEACRALIEDADVMEIEAAVLAAGALAQRESFLSRRLYDDDWYMRKFRIPF